MNFEDFFLDSSNGGGAKIDLDIKYVNSSNYDNSVLTTPNMFSSSGLSLGLQMGKGGIMGETTESSNIGGRKRSRDEETNKSRSESDDGDGLDKPLRKKKIYHRHTPHQIQQLESVFKEFPHPDEKQRLELSKRLCLETKQIKFWFQNRRTVMKTQLERHENSLLRQENNKLRAETMSIREALRNPTCTNCGGPAMIGELSFEEQHLRIDNMRLKDELDHVCTLTAKFLDKPITSLSSSMCPPIPNSSLELGFGGLKDFPSTLHLSSPDFIGISSPLHIEPCTKSNMNLFPVENSVYLELALAAMDELMKMTECDEMLWIRSLEGGRKILNHEEYTRTFNNSCIGMKPNGYVTEASRESGMVIINSLALVETLMDSRKWQDMFPGIIARSSTTDVISNGMGGTRNGVLQLMHAELQVLSPLVPVRVVNFLRFCKQHAEGVWAVVDVSLDTVREANDGTAFPSCRRLPSGCLIHDMPNGYSKVTWVEHAEYDESVVHQLYRPLISVGMGFGAQRWLATLQRQCEYLAILMSSPRDHTATITPGGRKSMLKLAQRMISNFCSSICASTIHKWNKLDKENVDEEVRVMTRKSVDDPGEPHGIVVSAVTSVWLPVSPQRLFDFLRDEGLRSAWDILSNGGPMQEMAHIAKGQDHGNCVSLLRANANTDHHNMLVLQETCIDASGSLVVYAPVDIPAMHVVINGGDSAYVAVLPSGFAIVPDGPGSRGPGSNNGIAHRVSGSLLTVAFQILVNSLPTASLTVESVETVNNLIFCTVQRIKAALHCES